MDQVTIRPCTIEDAETVERLRVAGWQAAYRGLIPGTYLDAMPVDIGYRRQRIAERTHGVTETVAVSGTTVVGWAAAGPCRDGDRTQARHGEIYACYVLPGWWGRGVGRVLLDHILTDLARADRTDVTLWVLEGNHRARGFYQSHGFAPDGTRKHLDFGDPVPEVRYQRHLAPPEPGISGT